MIEFQKPLKAYYATSPSWKQEPFEINDDQKYVMKGAPFIKVPYSVMQEALLNLEQLNAVKIEQYDLKEPLDFDPMADNCNLYSYLLCENVFMRMRVDSERYGEKGIHSLVMVGGKDNIEDITKKIILPNPLYRSQLTQ